MDSDRILYAITVSDVENISDEIKISFSENDLDFIEKKIGDYLASRWSDSIEYALNELKNRTNDSK